MALAWRSSPSCSWRHAAAGHQELAERCSQVEPAQKVASGKVPNKTGLRKTAIPFLLPHEILHCLAESSSWQEIHRLFVTHLQCWQHIASLCERRKWRLFKIVPKHHYFQEMAQDLKRNLVNPNRAHACWYDESFLGYIKKIATACHSSSMIQSRFWQRYLLLLAMRFEDARRCSR
ncbi:unnamed protein product [Effrenium voratum]|uniref:Uncharacterized protein n=1 Tax=Effrenium voratum TaxID=2562239 RepID=A0AA36ILF7_9DINO|nr:unnamed protein product [Effrenium voratum]